MVTDYCWDHPVVPPTSTAYPGKWSLTGNKGILSLVTHPRVPCHNATRIRPESALSDAKRKHINYLEKINHWVSPCRKTASWLTTLSMQINHEITPRFPINTKDLYNICTMSDQRRKRWVNVVQMLYKCFVFARIMQNNSFYWTHDCHSHFENNMCAIIFVVMQCECNIIVCISV